MLIETQATMIAKMLKLAAEELGNHGCNDMDLDNTPENMAFVKNMIAAGDYPEDVPRVSKDGRFICVMDWQVALECARLVNAFIRPAQTSDLLPCPFCGGDTIRRKDLRDGYEKHQDDPDAWAHYVVCRSCASQGGWAKSESGAARWWNMRVPQGSHLAR